MSVLHSALLISAHQLDRLLGHWGYGLMFTVVLLQASGVPVLGTTALILAATYAGSTHRREIAGIVLAVAWALSTGLGYYYLGDSLSNARRTVNVALAVGLVSTFAASVVYVRRRGLSLRLAAERAYPEPAEP